MSFREFHCKECPRSYDNLIDFKDHVFYRHGTKIIKIEGLWVKTQFVPNMKTHSVPSN